MAKAQSELKGFERPDLPEVVEAAMRYRACRDEGKRSALMQSMDEDERMAELREAMKGAADSGKLKLDKRGRYCYSYCDGDVEYVARYKADTKTTVVCDVKRVKA